MVQVVKFPAGTRCRLSLTPHFENQSKPDLEALCDPDLIQIRNLQCQKGQCSALVLHTLRSLGSYMFLEIGNKHIVRGNQRI